MKEQILSIKPNMPPKYGDRNIQTEDYNTIIKDKKGNRITLAAHKRLYPYIVANEVLWTVSTTIRDFSFTIPAGYFGMVQIFHLYCGCLWVLKTVQSLKSRQ